MLVNTSISSSSDRLTVLTIVNFAIGSLNSFGDTVENGVFIMSSY